MQVEIRVEQKAAHRQKLKCTLVKDDAQNSSGAIEDASKNEDGTIGEGRGNKQEKRNSSGDAGKRPPADRESESVLAEETKKAKKAKT
jgi:hypothetical protein